MKLKSLPQRRIVFVMLFLFAVWLVACNAGIASPTSTEQPASMATQVTENIGSAPEQVPTATQSSSSSQPESVPTEVPTPVATTESAGSTQPTMEFLTSAIIKLNLNTASGDDFLTAIPGFGNRMVREFMEYRPYVSIQQFRREIGKYVDDAQVAEYEKYVYVPIDINESDAATLQQMSGLDATEAEALVASRPYNSTDAFLAKLAEYVSATELVVVQSYLDN